MSTHTGSVFQADPTTEMDSEKRVTQVTVWSAVPETQRYIRDSILQSQAVRKPLAEDPTHWQLAFYIPVDGSAPVYDDVVSWDGGHVWWERDGVEQRVRKIGFDFDPNAPLH